MEISEEVYQRIEAGLNSIRHTNQTLIKHGTEQNKDLIAAEFEKGIREVSEAMQDVEIVIELGE